MKGKRYAIVRVDDTYPSGHDGCKVNLVCVQDRNNIKKKWCENCLYGDTKEQLIRKIAQALLIDEIERYRKAPNCDVNKTIIEHESRICLEKARKIVEFLGVE